MKDSKGGAKPSNTGRINAHDTPPYEAYVQVHGVALRPMRTNIHDLITHREELGRLERLSEEVS